jgi:hypothetical protein
MKTTHLLLVAVLVGAMGLAPTKLPQAQAAVEATSSVSNLNLSTVQYGAVAGSSPSATTTSAYSVPAFTAPCSVSNEAKKTDPGEFTIDMKHVTDFVVGMEVTAAGIPAGAIITAISNGHNKSIDISLATTATIAKDTPIVAGKCYRYFSVNNIQNTALNSFGIQQTFASISPDTVTMQRCSGTWTEATGACSGAITEIVSGTSTSAVTTVPVALAASTGTARLRLSTRTSSASVSISVQIRRAIDVAAGTTTNS